MVVLIDRLVVLMEPSGGADGTAWWLIDRLVALMEPSGGADGTVSW